MQVVEHQDLRDGGARKASPEATRLCAATGETRRVDQMIRFVLDPAGAVVPDVKRRLPGRGLWIAATRDALELAIKRNVFARGFKREVTASAALVQTTERLLEQGALDALSIAHKAGKVAIGFGRVEAALAREKVLVLLNGAEAATTGVEKLHAARARRGDAESIVVIGCFGSAQLDLALGRSNVIHAALLAGRESEAFLARAARLHCFRTGSMAGLMETNGNLASSSAETRPGSM